MKKLSKKEKQEMIEILQTAIDSHVEKYLKRGKWSDYKRFVKELDKLLQIKNRYK